MNDDLKAVLLILAMFFLFMFGIAVSSPDYEATTKQLCQQYKSVPEAHLDRVPDGCVPEYYR